MSCKPSQQDLRIEGQLISIDDNDPYLSSQLRMAMGRLYADKYAMNRHDPESESEARQTLLSRLSIALEAEAGHGPTAAADPILPQITAKLTVDDYLDAHKQLLDEKKIAAFRPLGEFLLVELLDGRVVVQQTNLVLEMPLEPMLVCLDHTKYWQMGPQVAEAGRIYTTYLIDTSTGTNLCEIEPSYDLRHLYSTPENDNDERSISEWVSEHDDPSDAYRLVRDIDRLPESKKLYQERTYIEAGETYEQTMERMMDRLRGNVELQVPDTSRDRQTAPCM